MQPRPHSPSSARHCAAPKSTWSLSLSMFFFSSRRRHTRLQGDWSSDVCSSDLPRRSPNVGTTAAAPVRRYASISRSTVATRTWGRSTGHTSTPDGRTVWSARNAARSEAIDPPVTSVFSTTTQSCTASAGRMREASGPSTTRRGLTSRASSASRIRITKGWPRKSRSALGVPMRSERPAANTSPARDMRESIVAGRQDAKLSALQLGPPPPNWRPMAVRRIRQLGDPVLRARCERVHDPKSAATRLIADDLRDTLRAAKRKYRMGRALAAPQIGAPVRIVFVEIDKQRWTMVNPEITDVGPEDFFVWDDCFSFPNLFVRVTRAYTATLTYTDLKEKQHTMQLDGPMSELLQHEIDHLDGILAVDRASGLDPFAFRTEWEKLHKDSERYGPPKPREI